MATEYQVRVYRVRMGEMDDWLREWREMVVPLRRRLGFGIVGAWTSRAEDRFAWILSYDGPESFEEASEAYYASPQRMLMSPDPARHLESTESWLMEGVPLDEEG